MNLSAKRLLDRPIIEPSMDQRMGENINGPSLIRVPEWIDAPLGKYYLYFAHHKGTYIRMAYADSLTGPWTIYSPGVLGVEESLFEKVDPPAPDDADRSEWSLKLKDDFLYAHVASPDVHVDHEQQKIRLYYHGLLADGSQLTRLATSSDGIHFSAMEPLLGLPYFRVFQYRERIYAVSWAGAISRANSWEGPFTDGPRILPDETDWDTFNGFRHGAVSLIDDKLIVFYSRIGDQPERIVYVTVALDDQWDNWSVSPVFELIKPAHDWEGADCKMAPSHVGAAESRQHELRDPCYFRDEDGKHYLLYSGAGESAIGIAELQGVS